ncbi:YdaU family protein [Ochrobactrum ciceri]|uniref:YdaU family protein n=1 Tax=Brucella ciceri TaxID=391287 RepID=A0ABX1DW50_9HYPH|nr:YdaU family protein [Brucella ciceri]
MSRDRIPYFDFYPSDFMHGVRGLSAQEVGVYTMMLCRIYEENGPVEFHVMRLATYCTMRESTFVKTVEKLVELGKLQLIDGMITNHRAETEISSRANKLKNNSKAGKASAEKGNKTKARFNRCSTTVQPYRYRYRYNIFTSFRCIDQTGLR